MHQPRPYGLFGAEGLGAEDVAFADSLMRQVTNLRSAGGVDALRITRALPGGGSVTATDAGGVRRVLVSAPDSTEWPVPGDGPEGVGVPMLFSGAMRRTFTRPGEKPTIDLTEQTRRRLNGYKTEQSVPKQLELERFQVDYAPQFRYFVPSNPGIMRFTQYHKLRASWYSGSMAQVVQIVSGYGRTDVEALPRDRYERAAFPIPPRVEAKVRAQMIGRMQPGFRGVPALDGQIRYDYKFGLTNGVAFGADGKPWLLQIDQRGVFAMPLPLILATTTPAFSDYIDEVGDGEIREILDRFGGLPSGETFPASPRVFEAWRKAGAIIKVCGVADFFSHNAMYAACGWSFNSAGSEAFNTAWRYRNDGLMEVASYMLRLSLGALPDEALRPAWRPDMRNDWEVAQFEAYTSSLLEAGLGLPEYEAVRFKLQRSDAAEIILRAKLSNDPVSEWSYWSEKEIDPIAAHSGTVTRVGAGPVYFPGKRPQGQGRLKFPELSGLGCESFVMVSPDYAGGLVPCDTVMFGCYVQDQLRVIKYFIEGRDFFQEEESTFEEIMIVGSWSKVTTTGTSSISGNFYTTDFDKRAAVAHNTESTTVVGKNLGYGTPAYGTPPLLFRVGRVTRTRYYFHKTNTHSVWGESMDMAACVPAYERDAILYPFRRTTTREARTESVKRKGIDDPNQYQLWCHDSIFHYMGRTDNGNMGEPPSKDGTPVYVDTHLYFPTEVSDFADGGNWLNLPPGGFLDVTGICGPYTSRYSETHHAGGVVIGGEAPQIDEYEVREELPGSTEGEAWFVGHTAGAVKAFDGIPSGSYFVFLPDGGSYMNASAERVAFGRRSFIHIREPNHSLRWGHTRLYEKNATNCFIGVINE